jgi:hypothetical protein
MKFRFSELIPSCIIWKNNLMTLIEKVLNFHVRKLGGLHEKHAVTTSNKPSQHLLKDRRKSVSRWPVAGPSGYILTSGQQENS